MAFCFRYWYVTLKILAVQAVNIIIDFAAVGLDEVINCFWSTKKET
jgi:hypothetical protein